MSRLLFRCVKLLLLGALLLAAVKLRVRKWQAFTVEATAFAVVAPQMESISIVRQ